MVAKTMEERIVEVWCVGVVDVVDVWGDVDVRRVWGKRKREREEAGIYYRKKFIRVRCLGRQEALIFLWATPSSLKGLKAWAAVQSPQVNLSSGASILGGRTGCLPCIVE